MSAPSSDEAVSSFPPKRTTGTQKGKVQFTHALPKYSAADESLAKKHIFLGTPKNMVFGLADNRPENTFWLC